MPQSDDDSREALKRLDQRLKAFKPDGAPAPGAGADQRGISAGYRLVGELLGGVLGGLGLGWTFDHFAHTTPLGIVIGLLLGLGASLYAVVRGALRMGDKVRAERGTAPDLPADDD